MSHRFNFSGVSAAYCILLAIICVLTFFPGWMTPDSYHQYMHAKTGHYVDWHPVIMAWIWSGLDFIYTGPAGFLILNVCTYWLAVYLIASGLNILFGPISGALSLFLFTSPGLTSLVGVIWKDIFFATLMLLSFSVVFWSSCRFGHVRKWVLLIVVPLTMLAVGSKPNGLPAVFFLFVYFFYLEKRDIKNLVKAFGMTAIAVIVPFFIAKSLKVEKSYPFQYTQTYDLLGISVLSGENVLPDYISEKIEKSGKPLKSYYYPGGNNILYFNTFGNISINEPEQVKKLWTRWESEIRMHPGLYLKHRWDNFSELLRLGSTRPAYIANVGIVESDKLGFGFTSNLGSDLIQKIMDNGYFFLPWVYIIISIISFGVLCLIGSNYLVVFSVFLMGWSFVLPHFLIAPAADYRYLYFFYLTAIFLLAFMSGALIKRFRR